MQGNILHQEWSKCKGNINANNWYVYANKCLISHYYTTVKKFGVFRSLLCSPSLCIFDYKYNKNSFHQSCTEVISLSSTENDTEATKPL